MLLPPGARVGVFIGTALALCCCVAASPATDDRVPLHPAHKVEPAAAAPNEEAAAAPAPVPLSTGSVLSQRQGRFLFPGFTNALTGNPSLSSVLTLNLNNLAMVGLFLIGVFVLLPSVIGFLSGLAGTQAPPFAAAKQLRADVDPSSSSSMWSMMRTLDTVLSRNNIDVRVCLERAACHVAKNSFAKTRRGQPSTFETALHYAISSNYGQTLLASYRLKEAADRGKNGDDCDSHYSKCPYSLGNLSKLLATTYASGAGAAAAAAFFPSAPSSPPAVNATAPATH